jgi:hypothetical protein
MEKILNEFRVVETDDGYRIEIKGDKEKLRSFVKGVGGHRRWHRRHGRGLAFGFPFHPMMWAKMASCWSPWENGEEEGEAEPR